MKMYAVERCLLLRQQCADGFLHFAPPNVNIDILGLGKQAKGE